jgi:archaellum component FlaC
MLNTEFEIQTFRRLLDVNWEISEMEEKVANLKKELAQLESDLQDSMGKENWSDFLQMGKEMMSEKKETGVR